MFSTFIMCNDVDSLEFDYYSTESRIMYEVKRLGLFCVKSVNIVEKVTKFLIKPEKMRLLEIVIDEATYIAESLLLDVQKIVREIIEANNLWNDSYIVVFK